MIALWSHEIAHCKALLSVAYLLTFVLWDILVNTVFLYAQCWRRSSFLEYLILQLFLNRLEW